jgi:hypothetical protein
VNKYKTEGCRCDDCRQSVRDLEAARRSKQGAQIGGRHHHTAILCGTCHQEIEHCQGAHGDWMHTTTRSEVCKDGRHHARPETVDEFDARFYANRRRNRR